MQDLTTSQTETNLSTLNFNVQKKRNQFFHWMSVALWCLCGASVIIIMIFTGVTFFEKTKTAKTVWYDLLILIALLVIGILGTINHYQKHLSKKNLIFIWLILGVILFVSIWLAIYESGDWYNSLAKWCLAYKNMTFTEALRKITIVSDYTPFYNYFIIIFAHIFDLQNCLYAIKYLTFLFSIALAVVMELIICEISNTKFSYLHLVIFLLLPPILLEFTAWGQCDAIYTMFALIAFYFALKHRSILCFINLGLAFALKLQFLFIAPIIFVMLIIRDADGKKYLSWKWVWIAPLMYAVNLLPALFGADVKDLLLVYFAQTGRFPLLSNYCLNLPFLLEMFISSNEISSQINSQVTLTLKIIFAVIGIIATIVLLILVLRANQRHTLTKIDLVRYALCFAMIMVYLMPKMHDRFYFIAFTLSVIYLLLKPDKFNQFICLIINVALTFSIFTTLLLIRHYNQVINDLILEIQILGMLLNTIAIIFLLKPIITEGNQARKNKRTTTPPEIVVDAKN